MNDSNKKLWFGSKKYGWGWVPSSWQGWLSILIYGGAVAWSTGWFAQQGDEPQATYIVLYTGMMLLWSTTLVVISRLKGPKPQWRWGSSDKNE